MNTLSLAKNGYVSSSKRIKQIKAKYFFIKHYHHSGEITLTYCPTDLMWADILTKPLQGSAFRTMREFLMNCPVNYFTARTRRSFLHRPLFQFRRSLTSLGSKLCRGSVMRKSLRVQKYTQAVSSLFLYRPSPPQSA
jgi:hypothetical protein